MELGCLCTGTKHVTNISSKPNHTTFQSQEYRSPDGRRYRTVDASAWFSYSGQTSLQGTVWRPRGRLFLPRAGYKGLQRGFFQELLPVCPISDPFSFPLFNSFSFFFHSYFSFSFPALGTLSYYLIPLCNFWEKVIADPYTARRARRLQRQYVFITIIFVLN